MMGSPPPPSELISPPVVYVVPPSLALCSAPPPLAATSGWSVGTLLAPRGPGVTWRPASDCTPAVARLSGCEIKQRWGEDSRYYDNSF